jgi:hypothetical protein
METDSLPLHSSSVGTQHPLANFTHHSNTFCSHYLWQFLSCIITGNEMWVHHSLHTTTEGSVNVEEAHHKPHKKEVHDYAVCGEGGLTEFWDAQGILFSHRN